MNKITVPDTFRPDRVDAFLSDSLEISRSNLKNRLSDVVINGITSKLSKKVAPGDVIEFTLSAESGINIVPEKIELDILYEDENVFVINKPCGMVVHPAAGNYTGTMAQGLMYKLLDGDADFEESDNRPGIVHRLDKDTSGIIIAAKNTAALEFLSNQFRHREAEKTYLALVSGRPASGRGKIEGLIGRDKIHRKKMTWKTDSGKSAVTEYKVLGRWKEGSLLALYPKTGRTHQLRVHMLSINTPIIADPVYSRYKGDEKLMLHAYKLRIVLPGGTKTSEFRAPLPDRFKRQIISLAERD